MRSRGGFTLIEMLVALAIMGVLAVGLAVAAAGSLDAARRGERLADAVQTARHLAERIDRLLASADPTTVAWDESGLWSTWIEAGPPGQQRVRLDWIWDGTGKVVETRGGGPAEILVGADAAEAARGVGTGVRELRFRPLTRSFRGVRHVRRVEVLMTVEARETDGWSVRLDRRWHAPVLVGEERFR